jgi:hypothetical protein|tara:strand:- start:178 stop:399 length:222 start_codon:yes stop_codon:yes gene_type:complete
MSKYTIVESQFGGYDVKEKTRTHTGVRWLTIENYIDSFETLEEAKQKYPRALIQEFAESEWEKLVRRENQPSI